MRGDLFRPNGPTGSVTFRNSKLDGGVFVTIVKTDAGGAPESEAVGV